MDQSTAILAFVREWNSSMVRIHCPFCLQTHTHGPGSLDFEHDLTLKAFLKRRRVPHCGHLLDHYQMCFPFENPARSQGYSWYLDKMEMRYVTLGLPPEIEPENYFIEKPDGKQDHDYISTATSDSDHSENDSTDELAAQFQSKATIEDSEGDWPQFYKKAMANPQDRKKFFISHCLCKKTLEVRRMLRQYKTDKLSENRDQYGDDVVSLVAAEGHVCVLELLHEAGAGVANINNRGRTPLMEAILWGREQAVKFLLEKGADPLSKDHRGRTALDLGQDTDANRREREKRSDLYTDTQDLRLARVRICARLENLTRSTFPPQGRSPNSAHLFDGHFRQIGHYLTWFNRAIEYNLDYDSRTVGILSYDGHTVSVAAMSGANHYQPGPQTLDNETWTEKVRDICEVIGYPLTPDRRDGGKLQGFYMACHAEKQLAAYHIDRHFFWDRESRDSDVLELEKLRPLGGPPKAFIVVNRPVCKDCDAFIRFVRDFFSVDIEVVFR
ncbi:hypothetical protein B0A52_00330 [Exophiala mesophila]|uniref:Single-strand DNA deaminase toxin A-like C-terminal domain-containing protein n=1 Tax=Exophiala mesophila TaxID=212818 RepID=A0A438NJS2_EXOME|nr:hypothetical protein B0A52_00330 [Exophiala mesophila]